MPIPNLKRAAIGAGMLASAVGLGAGLSSAQDASNDQRPAIESVQLAQAQTDGATLTPASYNAAALGKATWLVGSNVSPTGLQVARGLVPENCNLTEVESPAANFVIVRIDGQSDQGVFTDTFDAGAYTADHCVNDGQS